MYQAYGNVCQRIGLRYRAVEADTGAIGGSVSHEFHVLADSGEDAIAYAEGGDYAANVEMASCTAPSEPRPAPGETLESVATPQIGSIAEVAEYLNIQPESCLKTLLVEGVEDGIVALVLRGDHELNPIKAARLPGVSSPLKMAEAHVISARLGCEPGSIGPVGLDCPVYADLSTSSMANFVCGANQTDHHLRGVNWGRDLPEPQFADIRNAVEGDPSPDGRGTLRIARGIEVGHVFQLGSKYSESMSATVLDTEGRDQPMLMGCYGIGVTRLVAAAIEQNNDAKGIVWPASIAPFSVLLVPINMHKSPRVQEATESLYAGLVAAGVEVLLDDRNARPGVKFADGELIGIPHRVVIGERGLDVGTVEYRRRTDTESIDLPIDGLVGALAERVAASLLLT
jgi:prolyl-tRNA synthetase